MEKIREWFPNDVDDINEHDLCLHLRAGDRLLMKGCFKEENGWPITPEQYEDGIESFDFERLHIVTDMPVWRVITQEELGRLKFHREVKEKDRIDLKTGAEYWNSLYMAFKKYNPIVRFGHPVENDFSYMRQFKKFMFAHGTLSWWAAALGVAEEVSVYGKWRGGKEIDLAWADLPGWRQWGPVTAPPRFIKEQNLLRHADKRNLNILVETGTRKGTMLKAIGHRFKRIYTIELLPEVFKRTQRAFGNNRKIEFMQGDSGEKIVQIMNKLDEPALFWLDAHDGEKSTPIMKELENIMKMAKHSHTLVIDDCRYFGTRAAYPSVDEVKKFVLSNRPNAEIYTRFDSICILL
jgi:hypothetical protein